MKKWSESDKYFVNGSLKVYEVVDLSSKPLEMVRVKDVIYDGPEGDDFKYLLLDNGFQVNYQGRAIVRIPKHNNDDEYNVFFLENLVRLSNYGFTKEITLATHSQPSLLGMIKLKSRLFEISANLEKKNAEVDKLKRQILGWKSTMDAITQSMKKVVVDVDDLKPKTPPAAGSSSGDYLLRQKLMFRAANEELVSIAGMFHQHTGLTICLKRSSDISITPADLIQNLNSLKEFVESNFFY